MAKEILIPTATAGQTLYALVINTSGQFWRPASSAFETFSAGNYANYATAASLTEFGSIMVYYGDFPTGITSAGTYFVVVKVQAGGSPASSDSVVGAYPFNWTGASEATQGNTPAMFTSVQSSPTPTTTVFAGGSALSSSDNAYAGQELVFISGANRAQRRTISAYTGSTKTLTLTSALSIAPSSGDEFLIL